MHTPTAFSLELHELLHSPGAAGGGGGGADGGGGKGGGGEGGGGEGGGSIGGRKMFFARVKAYRTGTTS